jgi:hypothetical protein
MAIIDETLRAIVDAIKDEAVALGLVRQRSGLGRGVWWAEVSGRLADGAWAELRAHHAPKDRWIEVGLMLYTPLARGGQIITVGKERLSYGVTPAEVEAVATNEIAGWLALTKRNQEVES